MTEVMTHRGARRVTREELRQFLPPEPTKTYSPVGHHDLAELMLELVGNLMKEYEIGTESYAVSPDGSKFFGIINLSRQDDEEFKFCVGFRNSTDMSMRIAAALGLTVMVCDNMVLAGDITYGRKHTGECWSDFEYAMIGRLYQANQHNQKLLGDIESLKQCQLSQENGHRTLGYLVGKNILGPRQMMQAMNNWNSGFGKERLVIRNNEWDFYNACTATMKDIPPALIMQRHIKLHDEMMRMAA